MFQSFKVLLNTIRTHGLVGGTGVLFARAREKYHERRLGIRTFGVVPLETFGVKDLNCHTYVATSYASFKKVMSRYQIKRGDVFLDFGSGMGRAIILAAELPFERVIGVETITELHNQAVVNIDSARSKLVCKNVVSILADATQYHIADDVSVIFFYNPFLGEILDKVLANISTSLRRAPRKITILAVVPLPGPSRFEKQIANSPWIIQQDKFVLVKDASAGVIFETVLAASDL